MGIIPAALYAVSFYSALSAALLHIRTSKRTRHLHGLRASRRRGGTTMAAWLTAAIGVSAAVQFLVPGTLTALQRDASAVAQGEWWRVATALFVQDGGFPGAASNLVGVLLIGVVAERVWSARTVLTIFFVGGLSAEIVALRWQPTGAGNSIANFSVAASLLVWCLAHRPRPAVMALAVAAVVMWCGLLMRRDIHGAAAAVGCAIGVILSWREARTVTPAAR